MRDAGSTATVKDRQPIAGQQRRHNVDDHHARMISHTHTGDSTTDEYDVPASSPTPSENPDTTIGQLPIPAWDNAQPSPPANKAAKTSERRIMPSTDTAASTPTPGEPYDHDLAVEQADPQYANMNRDPAAVYALSPNDRIIMWMAHVTAFNEGNHDDALADARTVAIRTVAPIREMVTQKMNLHLDPDDPHDALSYMIADHKLRQCVEVISACLDYAQDHERYDTSAVAAVAAKYHHEAISEVMQGDEYVPYHSEAHIFNFQIDTVYPIIGDGVTAAAGIRHPHANIPEAFREAAFNHVYTAIPKPQTPGYSRPTTQRFNEAVELADQTTAIFSAVINGENHYGNNAADNLAELPDPAASDDRIEQYLQSIEANFPDLAREWPELLNEIRNPPKDIPTREDGTNPYRYGQILVLRSLYEGWHE